MFGLPEDLFPAPLRYFSSLSISSSSFFFFCVCPSFVRPSFYFFLARSLVCRLAYIPPRIRCVRYYFAYLPTFAMCVSVSWFVSTQLVSVGGGIGTDTDCAACILDRCKYQFNVQNTYRDPEHIQRSAKHCSRGCMIQRKMISDTRAARYYPYCCALPLQQTVREHRTWHALIWYLYLDPQRQPTSVDRHRAQLGFHLEAQTVLTDGDRTLQQYRTPNKKRNWFSY